MADDMVCFSGSSAEEIELAKRFWQSIYPPVKPKSALVVKEIDQRLRTAPKPQNDANYAHKSVKELETTENDLALDQFRQDAEKRRIIEEQEYKERISDFRKESQNLIQKRRKERIKKEEISSRVLHQTHEHFMDFSDSEEEEEDARNAMDDIEKFEAKLRQQEKLKPS
ncbi:UPF0722 protein [Exaiptasia diaphana]|uniref:Cilia- and flagella-associated protein HOATZ n=1 Tax=Exaiptasia diaphana TaxID=2652724 RepID=A0A913XQI2_EXADI|nr:UPF0722 protein [Exaiptasia diaphana]KXJ25158.1 UPF0722 protein [Exaiptasia diaphana]